MGVPDGLVGKADLALRDRAESTHMAADRLHRCLAVFDQIARLVRRIGTGGAGKQQCGRKHHPKLHDFTSRWRVLSPGSKSEIGAYRRGVDRSSLFAFGARLPGSHAPR
jgi:hypothetical protein